MGYTNYYTSVSVSQDVWDTFVDKAREVIDNAKMDGIELTGCYKGDNPVADSEIICFNGALARQHETFQIERECAEWQFCKTARKPYDAVVKAILIVGQELGVISEWSFDGDKDEEEYKAAFKYLPRVEVEPPKELTIDEKRILLAEAEYETLDSGELLDVLLEGCKGYNNMTDDEVEEQYSYME
jgi:hypothetical protein